MEWDFLFIFNSVLLGVGLAMDAFSVSLANGLHEPCMKTRKMCIVAGTFAFFQALMPMIGWICVHTIIRHFRWFGQFIPWIALVLLVIIGVNMILESVRHGGCDEGYEKLGLGVLLVQGIATSIDALSVGFTIAEYELGMALVCAVIIAVVTFIICMVGLAIGKTFGTRFSNKATIFGGIILIIIGIEIFITGVL